MEIDQIVERAKILLDQGRANDAIRELRRVLEMDPNDAEALSLYARCQFHLGQFHDGMRTVSAAIGQEPDNAYYHYLLGYAYYRVGGLSSATESLQKSVSLNPWFAEPFGLMAMISLQERKFEDALAKADAGLAVDPESVSCLNARATALNKLRRVDDAEQTMKGALSMHPDNAYTHASVGWNYLEKGKHKDATGHFREALRLSPDLQHAQRGLKEALKSKIPPYRWLLQYSFWVQNKGKRAMLLIPILLYVFVNVVTRLLERNDQILLSSLLIGLYLVFIVLSWIINPIANLFLYFHRDGKYALTVSEKWTALTVTASLVVGILFLVLHWQVENSVAKYPPMLASAFIFWLLAVPLADIQYPISWHHEGSRNKSGLVLSGLGLLTIILAFTWYEGAVMVGSVFLLGFVLNNWFGLFR